MFLKGQMSPGQMLPGQILLYQLKSVKGSPRRLCLKFGQNRAFVGGVIFMSNPTLVELSSFLLKTFRQPKIRLASIVVQFFRGSGRAPVPEFLFYALKRNLRWIPLPQFFYVLHCKNKFFGMRYGSYFCKIFL